MYDPKKQIEDSLRSYLRQQLADTIALKEEIERTLGIFERPPIEKEEEEIVPLKKVKVAHVAPVKAETVKRRKSHAIIHRGLLENVTKVLTEANKPLTNREVTNLLIPIYGTRGKVSRTRLYSSVSAVLSGYTSGMDKRFDKAIDNGTIIYSIRNTGGNS